MHIAQSGPQIFKTGSSKLMARKLAKGSGLRLSLVGGGCGGARIN